MKCPDLTPVQWFLILFIPALVAQLLLAWRFSQFMAPFFALFIGLKLLFVSLLLNLFALRAFRRHGTPHAPGATPTKLIESGVFVISRHPVYLSLVMATLGLGFILDTVWIAAAALLLFLALDRCVIAREEKQLEQTFPDAYPAYRVHTRRWC